MSCYSNRRIPCIRQLIDKQSIKIFVYMASKTLTDPYEKTYDYTNLNPLVVKAYVSEISPEALVWKSYGLKEMGAKELIADDKYLSWFKICNRVVIENEDYEVYREGNGQRALIQKRPNRLIRVVLQKKT